MVIFTPISPGELIDKITILEIKLAEITDETKLKNLCIEFDLLEEALQKAVISSETLDQLRNKLRIVNKSIWDSENDIRAFWNNDTQFLKGARNSHYYNDERARLKRAINELLGSTIIEEKSHPKYEHKV